MAGPGFAVVGGAGAPVLAAAEHQQLCSGLEKLTQGRPDFFPGPGGAEG